MNGGTSVQSKGSVLPASDEEVSQIKEQVLAYIILGMSNNMKVAGFEVAGIGRVKAVEVANSSK